ncbi:Replicase polyprotein 1a [Thelohanellus kitauei]|uniref:Replicase polyprotein 1a n=1 Tax=Thelohanellus kitauei TaxID=669202 RepID=A0A0C2JSY3_THEKT|nr:Replicase polyprotein 1a [Thelohanellus kitauei]
MSELKMELSIPKKNSTRHVRRETINLPLIKKGDKEKIQPIKDWNFQLHEIKPSKPSEHHEKKDKEITNEVSDQKDGKESEPNIHKPLTKDHHGINKETEHAVVEKDVIHPNEIPQDVEDLDNSIEGFTDVEGSNDINNLISEDSKHIHNHINRVVPEKGIDHHHAGKDYGHATTLDRHEIDEETNEIAHPHFGGVSESEEFDADFGQDPTKEETHDRNVIDEPFFDGKDEVTKDESEVQIPDLHIEHEEISHPDEEETGKDEKSGEKHIHDGTDIFYPTDDESTNDLSEDHIDDESEVECDLSEEDGETEINPEGEKSSNGEDIMTPTGSESNKDVSEGHVDHIVGETEEECSLPLGGEEDTDKDLSEGHTEGEAEEECSQLLDDEEETHKDDSGEECSQLLDGEEETHKDDSGEECSKLLDDEEETHKDDSGEECSQLLDDEEETPKDVYEGHVDHTSSETEEECSLPLGEEETETDLDGENKEKDDEDIMFPLVDEFVKDLSEGDDDIESESEEDCPIPYDADETEIDLEDDDWESPDGEDTEIPVVDEENHVIDHIDKDDEAECDLPKDDEEEHVSEDHGDQIDIEDVEECDLPDDDEEDVITEEDDKEYLLRRIIDGKVHEVKMVFEDNKTLIEVKDDVPRHPRIPNQKAMLHEHEA